MIIAFQTVLLLVILVAGTQVVETKDNKALRDSILTVFLAAVSAFIVSVMFL